MSKIDNPVIITILKHLVYDITQLFYDLPSCMMIYRILPEISKNLILRIINTTKNGKVELNEIKNHDIFINSYQNISPYIKGLIQMKILQKARGEDNSYIQFNEIFISSMKKILSKGIVNDNISFHRKPRGYENYLERGINRLYKFINEKIFDQINKRRNDNYINNFLTKKNYLHLEGDRYQIGKTSISLFLLRTEDMIKLLFHLYLSFCFENNNEKEKKLKFAKFLFYLTTIEPGAGISEFPKYYYDSSFEEYINFMNQTGFLIVKEDEKSKKYTCTPLIQCLFENNNLSKNYSLIRYGNENGDRFLFVETNMKFYAYIPYIKKNTKSLNLQEFNSSSTLKEEKEGKKQDQKTIFNINLLKTLFKIEMILPNLLIGYITRESLKRIFKDVKSESILQFLSDHMSLKSDDVTEINGKKYLINESVANQILILEKEKNSIQVIKPVICYYDFYTKKQYESYVKKMKEKQIDYIYAKNEIIVFSDTSENITKMNNIGKEING